MPVRIEVLGLGHDVTPGEVLRTGWPMPMNVSHQKQQQTDELKRLIATGAGPSAAAAIGVRVQTPIGTTPGKGSVPCPVCPPKVKRQAAPYQIKSPVTGRVVKVAPPVVKPKGKPARSTNADKVAQAKKLIGVGSFTGKASYAAGVKGNVGAKFGTPSALSGPVDDDTRSRLNRMESTPAQVLATKFGGGGVQAAAAQMASGWPWSNL